MEVKRLNDKSRLPEIYQLRVISYEESAYSRFVNAETYPDGYFDELDILDSTLHWVLEDGNKIIGSVRAVIMDNKKMLREDITKLDLPNEIPFAYCGRTAVHPKYRRTDAMKLLDRAIVQHLKNDPYIKFGLCYVIPERVNAVKRLGFQSIGTCVYDWGNGNKTSLDAFIWEKAGN